MKKLKLISSLLIAFSIMTLTPIGANAEWKQDSKGWWNSEGNSYSLGWKEINGEWYYFDSNGYMKTGWIQTEGKWYYLYDSGIMAKNTTINDYLLGCDGAWIQSTKNNQSVDTNITANEQDIREIALNQLTPEEKALVSGTWKDGKLSKIILTEGIGNINDKSYIGKEVYRVDFQTKSNSILDGVTMYISEDTLKLIGYGLSD